MLNRSSYDQLAGLFIADRLRRHQQLFGHLNLFLLPRTLHDTPTRRLHMQAMCFPCFCPKGAPSHRWAVADISGATFNRTLKRHYDVSCRILEGA